MLRCHGARDGRRGGGYVRVVGGKEPRPGRGFGGGRVGWPGEARGGRGQWAAGRQESRVGSIWLAGWLAGSDVPGWMMGLWGSACQAGGRLGVCLGVCLCGRVCV